MISFKKIRSYIEWKKLNLKNQISREKSIFSHLICSSQTIGLHKYLVICEVINNNEYIKNFFYSIINQTLNFKNNIKILAYYKEINNKNYDTINNYINKFPQNIQLICIKSKLDINNLKQFIINDSSDFITFTNTNDFYDINFFNTIDSTIKKYSIDKITILQTGFQVYYENINSIKYNDKQNYNINKNEIINIYDLNIQYTCLSGTTLYNKKHFLYEYLYSILFTTKHMYFIEHITEYSKYRIFFIKDAKIYYREYKFQNKDNSKKLEDYIKDINTYKEIILSTLTLNMGKNIAVYKYVCNIIIDKISCVLKLAQDNRNFSNLTKYNIVNILEIIKEIVSKIDTQYIIDSRANGFNFFLKSGIIETFKKENLPSQIVYIDSYDNIKNEIKIRFYSNSSKIKYMINNTIVKPLLEKKCIKYIFKKFFIYENIHIYKLGAITDNISFIFGEEIYSRISINGIQYKNFLQVKELKSYYKYKTCKKNRYESCWIMQDREHFADDNAEHFYRYLMNNHNEINIYFALRESSPHYKKLLKEGFNMLSIGSKEYKKAMLSCEVFASSHVGDAYTINYFKENGKIQPNKKFVFLQHGVIFNDLSRWLNSKSHINIMITSAEAEYQSIAADISNYKLTKREVALTGLARHDRLLEKNDQCLDQFILIAPTWRQWLMGKVRITKESSSTREVNQEFQHSNYFIHWKKLLTNELLHKIAQNKNLKIAFLPHNEIQPYLSMFELPEHIDIIKREELNTIQDIFVKSACIITDYSTMAADMAYLNKSIIYYQFDASEFFSKHLVEAGYFNYNDNGFGLVCSTEEEVIKELTNLSLNDFLPNITYKTRMNNFFKYRDRNCCKRIYDEIIKII